MSFGFTVTAAQKSYADRFAVSRGSVEIRLQDWADAKLESGSVDALLSLESIEHMPDRMRFAQHARRVLRPGGRMVVCTWLAAVRMSGWALRLLLEPIAREGRQAPLVTIRELSSLLGAAGFADVRIENLTSQVKKTWSVVILRMLARILTRPRYWQLLVNASASGPGFSASEPPVASWRRIKRTGMEYALFMCR